MVERVAVTNPEICMDLGKKIKYYEEIKNDVKNLKTTNQLLIKENIKKVSKIGLITSVLGTILALGMNYNGASTGNFHDLWHRLLGICRI